MSTLEDENTLGGDNAQENSRTIQTFLAWADRCYTPKSFQFFRVYSSLYEFQQALDHAIEVALGALSALKETSKPLKQRIDDFKLKLAPLIDRVREVATYRPLDELDTALIDNILQRLSEFEAAQRVRDIKDAINSLLEDLDNFNRFFQELAETALGFWGAYFLRGIEILICQTTGERQVPVSQITIEEDTHVFSNIVTVLPPEYSKRAQEYWREKGVSVPLRFDELRCDESSFTLHWGDREPCQLRNTREFRLMKALLSRRGAYFKQTELWSRIENKRMNGASQLQLDKLNEDNLRKVKYELRKILKRSGYSQIADAIRSNREGGYGLIL